MEAARSAWAGSSRDETVGLCVDASRLATAAALASNETGGPLRGGRLPWSPSPPPSIMARSGGRVTLALRLPRSSSSSVKPSLNPAGLSTEADLNTVGGGGEVVDGSPFLTPALADDGGACATAAGAKRTDW